MNCTSCGANLPQGAAACPLCGTPTPYNVGRSGSSAQYDPTVASSQPGSSNPQQYDPTIPAQPYGGTPPPPSTAYGSPSYGSSPSTPSYGTPSPNPYDASNPYASPPPPQQNYYGAPNQQQAGYAPVAPQSQPGGMYGAQPPKRRSRLGLILGIIAVVLIVACVGISFAVYQGIKQTGNSVVTSLNATSTAIEATVTASSNSTPTTSTGTTPTTSTSGAPSGLSIDSSAAAIVTNVQMASAVDSNFSPTKTSSTFVTKQTIYATFKTNANSPDGFVEGKWYSNGQYAFSSKVLAVKADFLGYLSAEYNIATQGTVEMYWCTKSDCSDAKLADVANFTVTSASLHGAPPPALAFLDINRP